MNTKQLIKTINELIEQHAEENGVVIDSIHFEWMKNLCGKPYLINIAINQYLNTSYYGEEND